MVEAINRLRRIVTDLGSIEEFLQKHNINEVLEEDQTKRETIIYLMMENWYLYGAYIEEWFEQNIITSDDFPDSYIIRYVELAFNSTDRLDWLLRSIPSERIKRARDRHNVSPLLAILFNTRSRSDDPFWVPYFKRLVQFGIDPMERTRYDTDDDNTQQTVISVLQRLGRQDLINFMKEYRERRVKYAGKR